MKIGFLGKKICVNCPHNFITKMRFFFYTLRREKREEEGRQIGWFIIYLLLFKIDSFTINNIKEICHYHIDLHNH